MSIARKQTNAEIAVCVASKSHAINREPAKNQTLMASFRAMPRQSNKKRQENRQPICERLSKNRNRVCIAVR